MIYYYTSKPYRKRPHVNTWQRHNATAESIQVFSTRTGGCAEERQGLDNGMVADWLSAC